MSQQGAADKEPKESWGTLSLWLAALLVVLYSEHHSKELGRFGRDGSDLLLGCLIAFAAVLDIRSGNISLTFRTYSRSEKPIIFWLIATLTTIVSTLLVFGSMGDLLGLWKFDAH
jgi:hypothetical protein